MNTADELKTFADQCIKDCAEAIRNRDFAAYTRHFDPKLQDDDAEEEFLHDIQDEQAELGVLKSHSYMGQVMGNQEAYPGGVRFVYGGVFTHAEGLVIVGVHQRDGKLYLNEHVYYWG